MEKLYNHKVSWDGTHLIIPPCCKLYQQVLRLTNSENVMSKALSANYWNLYKYHEKVNYRITTNFMGDLIVVYPEYAEDLYNIAKKSGHVIRIGLNGYNIYLKSNDSLFDWSIIVRGPKKEFVFEVIVKDISVMLNKVISKYVPNLHFQDDIVLEFEYLKLKTTKTLQWSEKKDGR